ncbi:MAG: T9SS type A sorting domain-containing protein [bacterium]
MASETRSGHTFLHTFTAWDSIEYDFAVKAIVQQNKPTSVPDELPQNGADQAAIQNYPNPFNQETVISLRLSEPQAVWISIYDISGRLVRNLVQNQILHPNGFVVWDGKNSESERVSTGIYFYTVRFGQTNIQTKKMLLIR